jgi:hypothetical protein
MQICWFLFLYFSDIFSSIWFPRYRCRISILYFVQHWYHHNCVPCDTSYQMKKVDIFFWKSVNLVDQSGSVFNKPPHSIISFLVEMKIKSDILFDSVLSFFFSSFEGVSPFFQWAGFSSNNFSNKLRNSSSFSVIPISFEFILHPFHEIYTFCISFSSIRLFCISLDPFLY